jgi:ribonucleoside-diphosphate reductase alpha chain
MVGKAKSAAEKEKATKELAAQRAALVYFTKEAAAVKPAAVADRLADKNAALLERAGLKMAVDPAASPADRQSQFAKFQIDAPACDNCGSITVRNGNCYLCHNCGNSMGCS